jgi:hypothetical protein
MYRLTALAIIAACSGEEALKEGPEAMLTGSVTPEGMDVSGDFAGYSAFAFDDQGVFVAYISSNPDTNCANVSEYLRTDRTRMDPEEILVGGKCNMFLKIEGFEGSFSADSDPFASAASSIECAMGEGEFRYSSIEMAAEGVEYNDCTPGSGSDCDYYWTGKWWVGVPRDYSWSFSGSHSEGYQLDIEMSTYSGSFIHEEFARYDAFGEASGSVTAYTCENLASTGLF